MATYTSRKTSASTTYEWNNSANWTLSGGGTGIPGSATAGNADDVTVLANSRGPANYDFNVSQAWYVGSLTVTAFSATNPQPVTKAATLAINANTLHVANAITLSSANSFITLAGGTLTGSSIANSGQISGYGTLSGSISGSGTILASGGTLDLTSAVISTSTSFQIAGGAALKFESSVATDVTVTFNTTSGTLILAAPGSFSGTISGLQVDTDPTAGPQGTGVIDLSGVGTITSASIVGGSTLHVVTASGTYDLATTGSFTGDYVNWQSDGSGGTQLWVADTVCFAAGTRIATTRGPVAVEALTTADSVITADGTAEPITWIGVRALDLTAHPRPEFAAPVLIRANAFAQNQPSRDLRVSPDHCLFVDGKLIPAKLLINDMSIVQERETAAVTYYHVELDRHAILLAEDLPAESYLDTGNRAFFSNAGLALVLHPEFHVNAGLACWETDACAPLAISQAAVQPIWDELADRAVGLGFEPPGIATTEDPDLHVIAAGRCFRPVAAQDGRYVFVLPPGVLGVRLASRATAPADVTPWIDDRRQLGVAVSRIVLRTGSDFNEMPVDHPALGRGWHAVETHGRSMWRWTDGAAALPIGSGDSAVTLEVHVGATATYRLDRAGAEANALAA
ncbi:MAG: hypothetical protein BGO51_07835 [Rhodospirillales bacterium 69-11]|nr:MAG: hypothetical protein BGO51_07835 [Rhodospirillales bacterium 69-11]